MNQGRLIQYLAVDLLGVHCQALFIGQQLGRTAFFAFRQLLGSLELQHSDVLRIRIVTLGVLLGRDARRVAIQHFVLEVISNQVKLPVHVIQVE